MLLRDLKKIPYYLFIGILVIGTVLGIGFLSFTEVLSLYDSIAVALTVLFLAGFVEGEVFFQSIYQAYKKLFSSNALEQAVCNRKLDQLLKDHPTSTCEFLIEYKKLKNIIEKFEHKLEEKKYLTAKQKETLENSKKLLEIQQEYFRDYLLSNSKKDQLQDKELDNLISKEEKGVIKKKIREKRVYWRLCFGASIISGIGYGLVFLSAAPESIVALMGHFGVTLSLSALPLGLTIGIYIFALIAAIGFMKLIYHTLTKMVVEESLGTWFRQIRDFFRIKGCYFKYAESPINKRSLDCFPEHSGSGYILTAEGKLYIVPNIAANHLITEANLVGIIAESGLIDGWKTDDIRNLDVKDMRRLQLALGVDEKKVEVLEVGETTGTFAFRLTAGMLVTLVVIGIAVFASVMTSGTWWNEAQAGIKFIVPYVTQVGFWVSAVAVSIMAITTLNFNLFNSLRAIKALARIQWNAIPQKIEEAWNNVKERYHEEGPAKFFNPFRAAVIMISAPFKAFVFLGHIISTGLIGEKSDLLPNSVTGLATAIGGANDGFVDGVFYFGENLGAEHHTHHHDKDKKSEKTKDKENILCQLHSRKVEDNSDFAHDHSHEGGITEIILTFLLSPLYLGSAIWEYACSEGSGDKNPFIGVWEIFYRDVFGVKIEPEKIEENDSKAAGKKAAVWGKILAYKMERELVEESLSTEEKKDLDELMKFSKVLNSPDSQEQNKVSVETELGKMYSKLLAI